MGTAATLRGLRVRAGKSKGEVSQRIGINEAWYDDLERDDDALASTLTLFQAMDLASLLGTGVAELVAGGAAGGVKIALVELPGLIRDHLAREGLSIEAFEHEVGWVLGAFLESPLTVVAEVPLAFLYALSAPLGIDWRALVPADDPA